MTGTTLLNSRPMCGEVLMSDLEKGVCELRGDRSLKPFKARIARMAKSWDWSLCDSIIVSVRNDGTLSILDGGTRYAALLARNYEGLVPCRFLYGLTEQEEAIYFARRGVKGVTINLTFGALVNAKVEGDDPKAVAFMSDLRGAGIILGDNCKSAERLWKAREIITSDSEWEFFLKVLYAASTDSVKDVITAELIGGLAMFTKQCAFPITSAGIAEHLLKIDQDAFLLELSQYMARNFLTAKGNGALGGAMFSYVNTVLGIPLQPSIRKTKVGAAPTE